MKNSTLLHSVIFAFLCVGTLSGLKAQVKVGDHPTVKNADAMLEVESTSKGILLPRVALTATNNAAPLSAHVPGMIVYNTATTTTGANDVTPGYYYNDGTQWVRLTTGGITSITNTLTGTSNVITSTVNGQAATLTPASGTVLNTIGFDATGNLVNQSVTSLLSGSTTVSNNSSGNNLTTTVNGVTGAAVTMVNSVSNTLSGTSLTTTVNGVSSTAVDLSSAINSSITKGDLTTTTTGLTVGSGAGAVLGGGTTVDYNLATGIGSLTGGSQGALGGTGNANTYVGTDGQTHLLPAAPDASSITNGENVTAASSKLTLGGTPTGAALKAFSIDVNEAALTLANQIAGGTNGQVLTSNGSGVASWTTPNVSSITGAGDVTTSSSAITLGGTPTGAALKSFSVDVATAGKTKPGVVQPGDGIAVASGVISADVINGLQFLGTSPNKQIALGGTLTTPTILAASAVNTLAVTGLQTAPVTDYVVTLNPTNGVLRQRSNVAGVTNLVVESADYTVTADDYTVVFNGTAAATFTLPSSPENGRMYHFVNIGTADVNFSAPVITANGGTTGRLGPGITYLDGNVAGNKITIQYSTTLAGWIQIAN